MGLTPDQAAMLRGRLNQIAFDRIFSDSAKKVLASRRGPGAEHVDIEPTIQPVVIVGRNILTDAQALDEIIDANERLRVSMDPASPDSGDNWAQLEVGDSAIATTGEIAGNAVSSLPGSSATDVELYEVEAVIITLDCDATVAARDIVLAVNLGLPRVSPWALNDWQRTMTATQSANENGSLLVPRAPGLVQENDNGTFATADVSPLPLPMTTSGSLTSTITNGVAGDAHVLTALVRRVA